ncbi:hypothetical protein [Capnocytophaga sputigena]|uniref:hypothetical protein n=1 Tax=Capnocytophaga sputigena TaxID=1019 RepID=UPI0028E9014F|nr:hypothetical protein [Capnocytophaga sputigena]
MKKYYYHIYLFFFCVFFFLSLIGNAQKSSSYEFYNKTKSLGIGLVKVESDIITINSQTFNKSLNEYIYTPKYIVPIFFKPEYNIFYIVCLGDQREYYKVLSANGEEYLVSKAQTKFISWEDFLKNTTGISNLDWNKNPLRKEPFEKSKIIKLKDTDATFNIIRVKKDWIEIQSDNNTNEKGWIQWKKENRLLIEIYLLI